MFRLRASQVGRAAVASSIFAVMAFAPAKEWSAAPVRTSSPADPVIVAAGDISCPQGPDGDHTCKDQKTSDRVVQIGPKFVLTLGDNQYEKGELANFLAYYDPTWGRVKGKTKPSPGNHEYDTPEAVGYFAYFGTVAGPGYYGFDVGEWRILSLDSEIKAGVGSTQYRWAQDDLRAHASVKCVLAYWHKARWGSGGHGSVEDMKDIWNLLYDNDADVVLSGHNHQYERFAPLDESGNIDRTRGMREFVVGSGGKDHDSFGTPRTGSEVRDDTHYGVLKLTLHASSYDWEFDAANGSVYDSGTQACH